MKDNISPEEKLLRLIRGHRKREETANKLPQITALEAKSIPKYSPSLQNYFFFLNIKTIIWIMFLLSCAYLTASFIYPQLAISKKELSRISSEDTAMPKVEKIKPKLEVKPYEFYAEGIKKRQLFSSLAGQQEKDKTKSSGVNINLAKDMNLIGIISGDNPQAVIEDKKTQKTYYLNKGQFIGEIQLEDILEGKVVLNYNGDIFELYL